MAGRKCLDSTPRYCFQLAVAGAAAAAVDLGHVVPHLVLLQNYPTSFIASIFHDPARALESEKIMETA